MSSQGRGRLGQPGWPRRGGGLRNRVFRARFRCPLTGIAPPSPPASPPAPPGGEAGSAQAAPRAPHGGGCTPRACAQCSCARRRSRTSGRGSIVVGGGPAGRGAGRPAAGRRVNRSRPAGPPAGQWARRAAGGSPPACRPDSFARPAGPAKIQG